MTQKVKYIIFAILMVSLTTISLQAQRLRYKDIYEVIESGDNVLAYSLLFEYQKLNPSFANTYFQLGLISYYNIKHADPFLDYRKIKYFHYNVHLFWGLASKYIQDNNGEVTRNRKYFLNVPELAKIKRISADDVLEFINSHMNQIDEYVRELDKIYGLFYMVVDDYTSCVDYYRNIISDFKKQKQLYLAPEEDIFPRLDTLKALFDSTMSMYALYKTAIESYPLKKYNQKVLLKPITLYRLEGITNTDFLSDTMLFWDYGGWVRQTRKIITTQILKLRVNIERHFNSMRAYERKLLRTTEYSDDYSGYYLPIQVIYQIEKYDINSIVSNILKYYKVKTDFLAFRKHKFNDTTDTLNKLVVRANYYNQENNYVTQLDSLLHLISLLNRPDNIYKFKGFFKTHFQQGLPAFTQKESNQIHELDNQDISHLKYFIFRDLFNYPFDSVTVVKDKDTVKLYISTGHLSKYVTMDVRYDPLHNIFVGGVTMKKKTWQVFVAKVSHNVLQWVKTISIPKGYMVPKVKVFPYTDGIVIDVFFLGKDGKGYNSFYRLDQMGNSGFSFSSGVSCVPRFIMYDDINNYLLAAYKGLDRDKNYTSDSLILEKWDVNNNTRLWRYTFAHTGDFVNIIRFDSTYYAFVNFKNITIPQRNSYSYNGNNVGLIRITESGELLPFETLTNDGKFYLIHAIKLSSEKFELTGFDKCLPEFSSVKYSLLPPLITRIMNKF